MSSESFFVNKQHTLVELTQAAATNVALLEKELAMKELPPFDNETFLSSFPPLSGKAFRARHKLISATGALDSLVHLSSQGFELGTVATRVKLRIPEHILPGGLNLKSCQTRLESKSSYAISVGFLSERPSGYVRHNAASSASLRNQSILDCFIWDTDITTPFSTKLFEALQLNPTGKDETTASFSIAKAKPGKPGPMVWDYYANNPKAERVFRYYMALTRSITVHSLGHVVRAFDWGQVKTVVDIGGSEGGVCMAIYDSYPYIKATVQDIGRVIATSP